MDGISKHSGGGIHPLSGYARLHAQKSPRNGQHYKFAAQRAYTECEIKMGTYCSVMELPKDMSNLWNHPKDGIVHE